jgi:hypothetical protein
MERRKVNYKVIYKGEETDDSITGKVYECIAEVYDEENQLHDLAVIDESEEDYLYDPEDFEKAE